MPVYNVTVDDSSPIIHYSPGWREAVPSLDASVVNYDDQSFHGTPVANESARFIFYGTAVEICGSTWFNHDGYTSTVDGSKSISSNGNSKDRMYKQPLVTYSDLSVGAHEVVLMNTPSVPDKWVDLDYITFLAGDGNPSTPAIDAVLDDVAASFTYDSSWSSSPNGQIDQYYGKTLHSTNVKFAKATLKFEGNAIALYGATSDNHGTYSVSLDNQSATTYNGTATTFRPQRLLFWAGGLKSGSHTLTVTNLGSGQKGYVDLDRAVATQWGAANTSGSSSSMSSTSTVPSTSVMPSASLPSTSLPANSGTIPSLPSASMPSASPSTNTSAPMLNPGNAAMAAGRIGGDVGAVALLAVLTYLLF